MKRPNFPEGWDEDRVRRRGGKVSSQTFDAVLENQLYIGIVDCPEYGVQESVATSHRWSTTSCFSACRGF